MDIEDNLVLSYIHVVCMALCMIAAGVATLTVMLGLPIFLIMFIWSMFNNYPEESILISFSAVVLGLFYRMMIKLRKHQ